MVHTCKAQIGPSLLAADMSCMAQESQRVVEAGADFLHLDVMDGHFVPNLTFGPPVIKSLRKHSKAFFDCHLMVSEPEKWVVPMADAGCDNFTFHLEATEDPVALIKLVRSHGMKVGIAIRPATPVAGLIAVADVEAVDLLLVMTVEPGFGAQKFMADMMPKVAELRAKYPTVDIEVDGGLGPSTIDEASKAGANMIVAGSAVFNSADPGAVMRGLRESVQRYGNGLVPQAQ